jgi:hypothetical protein
VNAVTQESLEPVLFNLVLEGAAADAQEFSRESPVLVRLVQSIDNHLFLSDLGKGLNCGFEA